MVDTHDSSFDDENTIVELINSWIQKLWGTYHISNIEIIFDKDVSADNSLIPRRHLKYDLTVSFTTDIKELRKQILLNGDSSLKDKFTYGGCLYSKNKLMLVGHSFWEKIDVD